LLRLAFLALLMLVQFGARDLEAHSRHQVRLHLLHQLSAVLHGGNREPRGEKNFRGSFGLQFVQNRNDVD